MSSRAAYDSGNRGSGTTSSTTNNWRESAGAPQSTKGDNVVKHTQAQSSWGGGSLDDNGCSGPKEAVWGSHRPDGEKNDWNGTTKATPAKQATSDSTWKSSVTTNASSWPTDNDGTAKNSSGFNSSAQGWRESSTERGHSQLPQTNQSTSAMVQTPAVVRASRPPPTRPGPIVSTTFESSVGNVQAAEGIATAKKANPIRDNGSRVDSVPPASSSGWDSDEDEEDEINKIEERLRCARIGVVHPGPPRARPVATVTTAFAQSTTTFTASQLSAQSTSFVPKKNDGFAKVVEFLKEAGLESMSKNFEDAEVDSLDVIKDITDQDLVSLGMTKLGQRKKFHIALRKLTLGTTM
ncbi:SAM domain-containing protein [Plasmodiophora brassicae]